MRTARPADATGRGLEVRRSDYLIKRALFAIVTVFVAITINFFLFRVLPGSAVRNLSRVPQRHARAAAVARGSSSVWTSRSGSNT